MVLDLHTHSAVSDGSDDPSAIPRLAAAAGCSAVALTDHDRLDGVPAARAAAAEVGIELVPGCEISCDIGAFGAAGAAGAMHVLVYFVEPGDGPLQDELVRLQSIRDRRNEVMCALLELSYDELLAEAGGIGAGRPHAAALLVRAGRATSIQDAFDRWLGKGRPGYVEKERLRPADALALVRASGAVAVLAHPLSLGFALAASGDLRRCVEELRDLGLAGVECLYGRYSPDERAALSSLARSLGLVVTGGSDYHGSYKPDLSIGVGLGDLHVPDHALDDLRARLPASH